MKYSEADDNCRWLMERIQELSLRSVFTGTNIEEFIGMAEHKIRVIGENTMDSKNPNREQLEAALLSIMSLRFLQCFASEKLAQAKRDRRYQRDSGEFYLEMNQQRIGDPNRRIEPTPDFFDRFKP